MFLQRYLWLLAMILQLALWPRFASASDWKKKGWEQINEENGIKVYRKSSPSTPVKGVGGEAMIDASIGKVLWVLMDHEHKTDWVDKFKSAYTIEEVSPLVHIQYASFAMPFPVTDRDFVYRYEFKVDKAQNAVIVEVKSTRHPKAPESKSVGVRGEIIEGRYVLYPRGSDRTFVRAEYLADPKGLLPSWVVNLVQKQWPYKTLAGLREQVRKPFVKEWDIFESQLKSQLKLASQP
jgi:hypothetical protein